MCLDVNGIKSGTLDGFIDSYNKNMFGTKTHVTRLECLGNVFFETLKAIVLSVIFAIGMAVCAIFVAVGLTFMILTFGLCKKARECTLSGLNGFGKFILLEITALFLSLRNIGYNALGIIYPEIAKSILPEQAWKYGMF